VIKGLSRGESEEAIFDFRRGSRRLDDTCDAHLTALGLGALSAACARRRGERSQCMLAASDCSRHVDAACFFLLHIVAGSWSLPSCK